MSVFAAILLKLAPLYLNILLGYIAGRLLKTPIDTISRLMFFIINPLIMFNGVLHTRIDASVLSLPFVVFILSCALCLGIYQLVKHMWTDASKNLVAFSAGTGNTGYFGLPLALLLFDTQGEGVYMMALLGVTIYENTLGFYILAKGTHGPTECLKKLFLMPSLYAALLALSITYFHIPMPEVFTEFMCHIKGTYTVLGMMTVGLGLAALHHLELDLKFLGVTFLSKFILWPAIVLGLIFIDAHWLHIYSTDIHNALILLSIVPMAVNTVIIAAVVKAHPEKAATAVLLSTFIALLYVPLMVIYFIINTTDLFVHESCLPV